MGIVASPDDIEAVAIIGLAGRFPGASDIETFWNNLRAGVESIRFFSDEELEAAGIDRGILKAPNYVKARAVLTDTDLFDAAFFGFSPREAEIMDPQQRIFLECAWTALEHAGYDSETYRGRIGVYAGVGLNSYWLNLFSNPQVLETMGEFQATLANDKDFLATHVSYKLNLKGPSVVVQTACSTSLVAVHLGCQSLLNKECDIVLAGGVRVTVPEQAGYFYQEGGIASPDGHCRPFDAQAQGTLTGNGVGIVVLKRLSEALADGDYIHAVIKGSAINNDGSGKVGYTAPSVDGQADVIVEALAVADVEPETISYVEAHGTATALGDPIEIAALTKAFRTRTEQRAFCAIGSLKSNIGHLDAAAGVAGLIKTVLALKHRELPPSLHFERPNPQIDFASSPFFVNAQLALWPQGASPRRAGVSSLGIGGTNAHMIVEEAPVVAPSSPGRPWHVLVLSAKTATALETATTNLAAYLQRHPDLNPADLAYTLQVGRRPFNYRRVLVYRDIEDAREALASGDATRLLTAVQEPGDRPIAFMFSGQGAQYIHMAAGIYRDEPVFREHLDRCAQLLAPQIGCDLRALLYPFAEQPTAATEQLTQTAFAQPALFAVEYALARLWISWGIRPQAMIGHSIGEYVAACLAGVFSLEDALTLVATRGRLMQQLPAGAMLAVSLAEAELRPLLGDQLALAAINGPALCVVSGPIEAIANFELQLQAQGHHYRRLHTSHAFHSAMMDPIVALFAEQLRCITLKPPRLPIIAHTGTWMTNEQATDPNYWARQLREPVRFADGLSCLLREPNRLLLEIGPGQALSTFARQHPARTASHEVLSSLRHPQDVIDDIPFLLKTLGRLWLAGVRVSWQGFSAGQRRQRLPLPTYPFERQRYWIERRWFESLGNQLVRKKWDIADWFYLPAWKRAPVPLRPQAEAQTEQSGQWLILSDATPFGTAFARHLQAVGLPVTLVVAGEQFEQREPDHYTIHPGRRADYSALLTALRHAGRLPRFVIHTWSLSAEQERVTQAAHVERDQERGLYSLIFLAQALSEQAIVTPIDIALISNGLQRVYDEDQVRPEKATMLGACTVIPQEYPNIVCRSIDIGWPTLDTPQAQRLLDHLRTELLAPPADLMVAYRGAYRWVEIFEPIRLESIAQPQIRLRDQGVYLITGGLGGIGLGLAEYLARSVRAKIVLLGRSSFPPRETWDEWLLSHDDQDPVSAKIRRLQACEQLGSELLIINADVADAGQLRATLQQIDAHFGMLHGVFHAAGYVGIHTVRSIQELSQADCQQHFQAKVYGVLALEQALQGRTLDFCLLFSSLAAILGGLGFAAYAAANRFMDAFAQQQNQISSTPWISVNWDGWRTREATGQAAGPGAQLTDLAMHLDEGLESMQRLLAAGMGPQVVVSTGSLAVRLQQWVKLETLRDPARLMQGDAASLHPRPAVQSAYAAPTNQIEQTLAEIWQQLLGIEPIGIHDNFFELGGHSLLAVQLSSRLSSAFQVQIALRSLFEQPTIAMLAQHIVQLQQAGQQVEELPLLPVPREGAFPLSFSQERLWFLDQLIPGSAAYHIPAPVRLRGTLDLAALEQSFNLLIQRHESLRTTFTVVDGRPAQLVATTLELPLLVHDLRALPQDEQALESRRLATAEIQRPFDLVSGPLVRMAVLRLADDDHVVLLVIHHIISDGWSMVVLIRELVACYQAIVGGQPVDLPPLPIQYADFAVWQRQWLQGERLESQFAYWKQQLADLPAALDLPTDRPRPRIQTSNGAVVQLMLPLALSQALAALSRQYNVTLFMTLLAAFQVLLARYSGQHDIVIGTPIANRTRIELEGLIGFFVNTLVLRSNVADNPSFHTLLERVRETTLAAYAHQDLPFEQLVEALQPRRDMSRSPLFQVMFIFQNTPQVAIELPDLHVHSIETEHVAAKFDLTLALEEIPEGIRGNVEYNTDLFDAATISRLISHFQALLEGIVAAPQQRIAELPLLPLHEYTQLLTTWNMTAADYPRCCVYELFEQQALHTPTAVAAIFEPGTANATRGRALTYHELNARANQLAHYLGNLGVGPGVFVGICLERSLDLLVGLLGILKAGGTYLPLDPTYPRERLSFMLADSQAPVLVTQQHLLDRLPNHAAQVICLDTQQELIAQEPDSNPGRQVPMEQLAYTIYTSGSTGLPKGVLISHRALANFIAAMRRSLEPSAADVLLSVTTLSFDIAALELFLPLTIGATVVLVSRETVADGAALAAVLSKTKATLMQATPATWRLLIQSGWKGDGRLRMLCGGEALSRELSDQLIERGAVLWNMYGPTETTVWSTMAKLARGAGAPSIGRPIANTQVYILDWQLQPVPIGVNGELYIGGDGLAHGYFNRPSLTAERFIPNPFAADPGARLYRTGDLARYRADGTIEYLGRNDHQVKLRGFRIELEEIEALLEQHAAVQQAVVVIRGDTPDNQRLVAYLVAKREQAQDAVDSVDAAAGQAQVRPLHSELRSFLQQRLPEYMVPSIFVLLEAFPLTPNGKVDRRALPDPENLRPTLATEYVPPQSELEQTIAATWQAVLKIDRVGASDNFFDLGGHSLLAVQIISRLGEALQIDLPLRILFEHPTVADLALAIVQLQAQHTDDAMLGELLANLEQLSEEDLQRLLAEDADGKTFAGQHI